MLNGTQIRAIARLEAGGKIATGFLVRQDGLLVTAYHALPDTAEPAVQVHFRVGASGPILARLVKGNREQDWALLQLVDAAGVPRAAPADVEPLPLIELRPHQALGRTWDTFGYPEADAAGMPRSGTFAIFDDLIFELEGNLQGLTLSGLSGAPLLIDGEVVGIVLQSDEAAEGVSAAGRLLVAPLRLLFSDEREPKLVPEKPPLFTDHVASYLPSEAHRYQAVRDSLVGVPDPLGPERVAAALLRSELLVAFRIMKKLRLEEQPLKVVLDYVASRFVPPDAARLLGEFCATRALRAQRPPEEPDNGPVAASLSATSAGVRWHVLRGTRGDFPEAASYTLDELGARTVPVLLDDEASPDQALEAVIDAAQERFPKKADSRLAPRGKWRPLGWFIVELDAWATPEVHRAIAWRFPGAHVLVRTQGVVEIPAELAADVVAVAPEITPQVFSAYQETVEEA